MSDDPSEKIVVQRSANMAGGRQYVYSDQPGVPKVRVVIEDGYDDRDMWNAFVDFAFMLPYEDLTPTQRVLHLIMKYDSEVQNGGHGQYFANKGVRHLEETLDALAKVGAQKQHDILKAAAETSMPKRAKGIGINIFAYLSFARQNEKYTYDQDYYACEPRADDLAIEFAKAHLDEFAKVL